MPPLNGHRSTKSRFQESDHNLIQQISAGDQKAFGLLYDRYKTLVFSLAVKIAGNHETAEDITLDVFTQIWEKADRYHFEKGSVKGWIASLAIYRSIDTLRRRKVRSDMGPMRMRMAEYAFIPKFMMGGDGKPSLNTEPKQQKEVK